MRRSLVARLVIWCMVLSIPASSFAADLNSAMLRVQGKVLVNGAELQHDRAVFAGDTIASGDRGSATLTLPGGNVQVQPNSTVTFEKDALTVRNGAARVSTAKGMTARVDNLTVTPTASVADYSVRRTGSELLIAAGQSSLTISDGVRTMTIEPGKAISIKAARAAAPQSGAEGLSGMQWLIIAAVAVVSTVTVVATTQEDESPVTP
jgi:hypothetical protein